MMQPYSDIHPLGCDCGLCEDEALGDPTLSIRMTMLGLLVSGVIVAISETVRHLNAIAAAVLS